MNDFKWIYIWSIVVSFLLTLVAGMLPDWLEESKFNVGAWEKIYFRLLPFLTAPQGLLVIVSHLIRQYEKFKSFEDTVRDFDTTIKALDIAKYKEEYQKFAQSHEKMVTNLSEIDVWAQKETAKTIPVNVANMDDYLIHLPYVLAKQSFRAESLEIETTNSLTDQAAIENVLEKGGIAIADPYFVTQVVGGKGKLIVLAPLVVEFPFIRLRNSGNGRVLNEHTKVLLYDKSKESTAGSLPSVVKLPDNAKHSLSDLVREVFNVVTINGFWDNTGNNQSNKSEREQIQNKLNELAQKIDQKQDNLTREIYEAFMYILSLFARTEMKDSEKNKIRAVFRQYSDFYLMEPELSFVDICVLENNSDKAIGLPLKNEKEKVFTAVITTKEYLKAHPIAVLKFLRALRIGILRCHALMRDPNRIGTLEKEFATSNMSQNDPYLQSVSQMLSQISPKNTSDSKENQRLYINDLYPNDLRIFESEAKDSVSKCYCYLDRLMCRESSGTLRNYLLEEVVREDKILEDRIAFIREGLGL
ncbi:hypothetical protein [Porphyromonas loveana]|uniref:hypothetical protein n=1 Tax=Porphyromonas loveana TaxID=1884669 RepID=UPI0035A19399